MTTTLTITDTQIRQLADDAGWHGDYTMMAICEIALTGAVGPKLDRLLSDEDRAIVARFGTPAAARAECARVLAEQGQMADKTQTKAKTQTQKDYLANQADGAELHFTLADINDRLSEMVTTTVIPVTMSEDPEKWEALSQALKHASYLAYRIRRRCQGLQA